ncbi:MAG: PQQ-dependent sugar dehydrogenase [Planctomycetes bacterium]|nr:PQQ-dependent sugar dehydrogenase [Planctomycetota bacterium]
MRQHSANGYRVRILWLAAFIFALAAYTLVAADSYAAADAGNRQATVQTGQARANDSAPPRFTVSEPFEAWILATNLEMPWEMLWGPDNMLWVTERQGKRITRINPQTGEKKVAGVIQAAYPGPQHEGVLGMAFAPGFLDRRSELFVYYTIKQGDDRSGRLVKFDYNPATEQLTNEIILMENIPAGDDHNGGRLRFGPDNKLYLSLGEQGHNQGGNTCLPIMAQWLPTPDQLAARDWDTYRGKVLRINPDGGIPSDNPVIRGVRSHIFTYGHRNPQGLYFIGNKLYSCEQGPSSDDELNLLEPGGNYGWPHVAGFRDGMGYRYANYSEAENCSSLPSDPDVIPAGVPIQDELEWFDPNFKPPVKTFYTVNNDHNFHDPKCMPDHTYLCYPTIAPSSLIYYPENGAIPAFRNSILMTTLKTGALFRLPMSGDATEVQGDIFKHFRSMNRYRAVAIDPRGQNIYIATDVSGGAKDDNGRPAQNVRNPGSILVFSYRADAAQWPE